MHQFSPRCRPVQGSESFVISHYCYHTPTVGGAIQRFLSAADTRRLRGRGRAASPPYQNNLHRVRGLSQFAIAVHRRKSLMEGQDEAA